MTELPSDPRARIVALDERRVWHPYTEMTRYRADVDPIVVVEAHGSRLVDADGHSYIDANASWWTSTPGHSHPRLVAALTSQAETLAHTALAGIAHPGAAELAEDLCAVAPALNIPDADLDELLFIVHESIEAAT